MTHRICTVVLVVTLSCAVTSVHAQLVSPGELASVHATLDGVQNCTKCHNFGDKTFRDQCLACHTEIKSRIDAKHGYHHTTRNIQCAACHKEHHGRGFKLIRWEPAKYDHRQTGFTLDGKHAGVECRKCHNISNIKARDIASKPDAYKGKTFLGLDQSCGTCHQDMHRGQLSNNCGNCHAPTGWKPVANFSHARARFKLAGKHANVECAKCHPTKSDGKSLYGQSSFSQFTGVKFAQCTECHKDQHKGAFGDKCDKCHTPAGWKVLQLSKENFNHASTRFPLNGKHATVACDKCHASGTWTGNKNKDLTKCLTCHSDYHQGQFASRTDKGECATCHTVDGFSPSLYELRDHKNARFALSGAHLAVPCGKCHAETTIATKKTLRFHWLDFACTQCHIDEHDGQFAEKIATSGCETCHSVQSWKELRFDHAATRFPLDGAHLRLACERCHKTEQIVGRLTVRYKLDKRTCADCHTDIHRAQFIDPASGITDCKRCHATSFWKPTHFDHNSMSRFALSGAHSRVRCEQCHVRSTISPDENFVRYKPLDSTCTSCHKEKKD